MAIILNSENTDKATSRKYYIVDFNNVKAEGLDGIEKLSADDNVVIFFGKSNDNVNFSVLSKLYSCKASIIMKEIENNDLINLVIAVFIGSIINENPYIYLICKNDENYAKAVELATDGEINITVQQSISGVVISPPSPPSPAPVPKHVLFSDDIEKAIKPFDLSLEERFVLRKILNKYHSRDLIASEIQSEFHSYNIYRAIKPYI